MSQNELLRFFFFQNSLCLKMISKLVSRYRIIKTRDINYNFRLKVIIAIDNKVLKNFKTIVIRIESCPRMSF